MSEDEKKLVWLLSQSVATLADGIKTPDEACDWADEALIRYEAKFGTGNATDG